MRTFAIITTVADEIVSEIHNRVPVIIAPPNYDRWLSRIEADALSYASEPMALWPISTRVNMPRNDTLDILERAEPFPARSI